MINKVYQDIEYQAVNEKEHIFDLKITQQVAWESQDVIPAQTSPTINQHSAVVHRTIELYHLGNEPQMKVLTKSCMNKGIKDNMDGILQCELYSKGRIGILEAWVYLMAITLMWLNLVRNAWFQDPWIGNLMRRAQCTQEHLHCLSLVIWTVLLIRWLNFFVRNHRMLVTYASKARCSSEWIELRRLISCIVMS